MPPALNAVDAQLLQQLRDQLPKACFREPGDQYTTEPRGLFRGRAGVVLAPETTQQMATIMGVANRARVPVVPYGGGTGLVGGQVMPSGPNPVVLSLERMNRILDVSPLDATISVQAGAILQDVQQAAAEAGRLFPLSLAAQGSCRIGGNLATNAGGLNVLRYGNARALCLGLEAVMPDGTTLHGMKRLYKDNTGYDLRDLFIGSEGTLGVITAATLRLFPQPRSEAAAVLVVPSPTAALDLLALARQHFGETISAFELVHGTGLEFLAETLPEVRQPFSERPQWSVLIDIGLSAEGDPAEMLARFFETALAENLVSDGVVSQSESQRSQLWQVRETIPEANKRIGSIASHDISVPLSRIAEFIETAGARVRALGEFRINCFGHLGDGNLHYNVFPPQGKTRAQSPVPPERIRRVVHDTVAEYEGSFSAEHGVGRLKVADLARYGDPARLAAMRAVKAALDPGGIMNPGALFGPAPFS